MKNWKELVGAVLLLACLGGCGIKHGVIVDKSYEAPYTYWTSQCYSYNSSHACTLNMPVSNFVPEHYVFDLRDNDKTGDVYVDSVTWHAKKIGDRY